jgi:hypothetical protein
MPSIVINHSKHMFSNGNVAVMFYRDGRGRVRRNIASGHYFNDIHGLRWIEQ